MKRTALLGTALVLGAVAVLLYYPRNDKNAPLAFVPADTPYVVANLDTLGDATYLLLQQRADKQLPASLATLRVLAEDLNEKDPHVGDLMNAFIKELEGKSLATIAQNSGLRLNAHSAVYGLGLSPVARFEIADAKAFEAFLARMETAYGKPLESAKIGDTPYRRYVSSNTGAELVVATVGNQGVIAVLPADVSDSMLRLALGLDRPSKSLQDDGRLEQLAKAKGYKKWLVGEIDIAKLAPLAASGTDPLYQSVSTAWVRSRMDEQDRASAKPFQVPAECQSEVARMAARVPAISLGYTRLDDKHQDMRFDVSLAADITKAFSGLTIEMPGLGAQGDAALDMTLGIPMEAARTFWQAQVDAVAKAPFKCEMFDGLNRGFVGLGEGVGKTAISPMNELLGLRVAIDKIEANDEAGFPQFSGFLVLGSKNPAGLFSMAQMANETLAKLTLKPDGKPVAISPDALPMTLTRAGFGKAWLAMAPTALAAAVGTGQDALLAKAVTAKTGDAGQIGRAHVSGEMYGQWLQMASQKALAQATSDEDDDSLSPEEKAQAKQKIELVKQQLEASKTRFAEIKSIDSSAKMGSDGLIIDVGVELK